MDLTLNYAVPGGDNGTVTGITNNVDTLRTQSFTYDPLNRILSAKSSATSGVDCWGQNFGPDGAAADDAVANLTKINNGTQAPPPCTFGSLNATVDANNRINADSTYATDANGNMTKDGSGTGYLYTFDAENLLVKATGMTGAPYCYVYDGNSLRVAKKSGAASDCSGGTVTKLYWRSISGDALAETDSTGSTTNAAYNEYVFFAGRRIGSRNGVGAIFYYFADQVGSTRTVTTGSGPGQTPGLLCYDADFTPYGQEIQHTERLQTTACPPSYKFTGYERDSETGLDYAFARYYSSRLGRFLSTDPLGGGVGNLQSHNAYAYVVNDPLDLIDPTGMFYGPCGPFDDFCSQPPNPYPPFGPCIQAPEQSCGPTGPSGPSGFPVGGGGGGDSSIDRAKAIAQKILEGNNDCANFFNNSPLMLLNAMFTSPGDRYKRAADFFQSTTITYYKGAVPPGGVATTQGGLFGPIQIVPNGPFDNQINAQGRTNRIGPFIGGTLGAEALILLHEFAHDILAIPADGKDIKKSVQNTSTISEKCYDTILQALPGTPITVTP
jgi:RHS repeat-associated protein